MYNLLRDIVSDLDRGNHGICVFLDFRKAFDLVDHSILSEKPSFYGVRGLLLD